MYPNPFPNFLLGLGDVKEKVEIKSEDLTSSHLPTTTVAGSMPAGAKGGKRSRRY